MRDPKPAYPIDLTMDAARVLRQLIRAHSTPQALVIQAQIVVTANDPLAKAYCCLPVVTQRW